MSLEEDILIQRYLTNQLSKEENATVSERIKNDPRFRESVLLEQQLSDALDEDGWSVAKNVDKGKMDTYVKELRSDRTQALKTTLQKLQNTQQENKQPKTQWRWALMLSAAVIVILLIATVFIPSELSTQELYASYYSPDELPSLVVRGDQEEQKLLEAQEAFETQDYDVTIKVLNASVISTTRNAAVYLYRALAQSELKRYDEALATLTALEHSEALDASKGTWYKAVVYLKKDDKKAAIENLKLVRKDEQNFNYDVAGRLLKELE